MNFYIQNFVTLLADVTQGVSEGASEAAKKAEESATIWQQISQCYQAHSFMFNSSICIAVIIIAAIPIIRSIQQKQRAAYLNQLAERLAKWLSSESALTEEELKPEFLLLLNGQTSPKLSSDIEQLTSEFTKINAGQCTRVVKVLYKKDEKHLQTTLTSTMEWEDVPSNIRDEFIMKNCKTVVFDFSKQSITETK